jgi:hypothetical protein
MADDDDEGGGLGPDELDELGELGGEDDEGADDDGKDDEDSDEWGDDKPPTPAQWRRAQRRLRKFAEEKRTGKGASGGKGGVDEQLRRQLGAGKRKGKDDAGDDDDSPGQAEATRWRVTAARQSAATALSAAGFSGTAKEAVRLTRLIDLEDAEPDSDGVFDFEDEVDELKEQYPELFGGKGSRRNERGTGRVRPGRTAPTRGGTTETDTERTTRELLRSAGFR